MKGLRSIITVILILNPLAGAARGIYCAIKMQMDAEHTSLYKHRLINMLIYVAVAETITALLSMVHSYYY